MRMTKVINDQLQLYDPLSPLSSNGWDSVGSSNSSKFIRNRLSKEATSQSSDTIDGVGQIISTFQSTKDLDHIHPSLHLCGSSKDYKLLACSFSDRVTKDPSVGYFFLFKTLLTRVKLELPFPPFYCMVLSVFHAMPIQIHLNGWASIRCFHFMC